MRIVALFAVLGFVAAGVMAAPASAADYRPGYKAKKAKKSAGMKRAPRVAGYRLRGGYRNGDDFSPYIYQSEYGNYPRFDNRSFSDRVFDGLRSEP
ncbi:MAG: hypothetical protein NW215_06275 [Hyphomicrobiales bacterium]|nr:hypothetical protein [Hyphomicrobiales bacterium]